MVMKQVSIMFIACFHCPQVAKKNKTLVNLNSSDEPVRKRFYVCGKVFCISVFAEWIFNQIY